MGGGWSCGGGEAFLGRCSSVPRRSQQVILCYMRGSDSTALVVAIILSPSLLLLLHIVGQTVEESGLVEEGARDRTYRRGSNEFREDEGGTDDPYLGFGAPVCAVPKALWSPLSSTGVTDGRVDGFPQ